MSLIALSLTCMFIMWVICMFFYIALCSSPSSPGNGRVTSTGNSVGNTATYSCNSGFELIGSRVATCRQAGNSASFSPAPPVCRCKY